MEAGAEAQAEAKADRAYRVAFFGLVVCIRRAVRAHTLGDWGAFAGPFGSVRRAFRGRARRADRKGHSPSGSGMFVARFGRILFANRADFAGELGAFVGGGSSAFAGCSVGTVVKRIRGVRRAVRAHPSRDWSCARRASRAHSSGGSGGRARQADRAL